LPLIEINREGHDIQAGLATLNTDALGGADEMRDDSLQPQPPPPLLPATTQQPRETADCNLESMTKLWKEGTSLNADEFLRLLPNVHAPDGF
jgi:hypothetical protein